MSQHTRPYRAFQHDVPLCIFCVRTLLTCWVLFFGMLNVSVAQEADTLLAFDEPIARFSRATALASDPDGNLYVVDQGAQTVIRLDRNGKILDRLGGGGSRSYQLDLPSDVDPTNGLEIYVADTGNARVQKFSREWRLLETIPMRIVDNLAQQVSGVHYHNADFFQEIDGEPVSVAVNEAQDVFAVDRNQGVVVRWNRARNVQEVFGELDEPTGKLLEPVSVATDFEGRVFVADRGQDKVMMYDAFGNFVRSIGSGVWKDLSSVSVYRTRMMVVTRTRLGVYETDGRLLLVYGFRDHQDLVDADYVDGSLFVLTANALFRVGL